MKGKLTKTAVFALLFCAMTSKIISQTYDLNTEFINRVNYVFSQLEKNRVPHGFLREHGLETVDIKSYGGVLTDSNKVSAGTLMDIYSNIVTSAIHLNAGGVLHPDYFDSLWQTQRQAGIITLCGLYYNYSSFKDNAVSGGFLTVTNDQFRDRYLGGVWQNPYQSEKVFVMSPSVHFYSGKNFQVVLPSNLWRTNNGSGVSSISVNFNDGAGYRTITMGLPLNVAYADTGHKTWIFRVTLTNGTSLYSHSEIKIKPQPNLYSGGAARFPRPLIPLPLEADNPYLGQRAQGWISVDYANPPVNGVLRLVRPLIVVEGFDPGHILAPENPFGFNDFNSFLDQLNGSADLQNLLQSPNQQYDIIYVDWAKGTDFLQRNGLFLERVIRWVNEQKAIDGTNEPNVVLGQSMGGVIARWALRDMETRGLVHQTRLFVSWDAPQLGAHIPIAYQHIARHGSSLYMQSNIPTILNGYNNTVRPYLNGWVRFINALRVMFNGSPWNDIPNSRLNDVVLGAFSLLDLPAARQMLIYRLNRSNILDNTLHDTWQQELRNMGYPQQVFAGEQILNVAVSNGSECAFDQSFAPYATLFSFNGKANTRILSDYFSLLGGPLTAIILNKPQFLLGILPGKNQMTAEFLCRAQPESGSQQIYKGKITYTKKILWLVNVNTTITNRSYNSNTSVLPIDNSPGGFEETGVNIEDQEFKNWLIKYSIQASHIPQFNFVPVTSALDIGRGNTPLTINQYRARYIGALPPAPPFNTPFVNFTTAFNQVTTSSGAINNNEFHLQISPRNGTWLAEELNQTPMTTNCSFVCGNNNITIAGPAIVCNVAVNYAINNFPGVAGTTATWQSVPAGIVNIVPNANGAQATVTRVSSGYFTLRATVNAPPNCGSLVVNSTSIRAGGFSSSDYPVSGTSTACTNQIVSFSTNTLQGATSYTWFWPGNWTYISGQNTPNLTLRTGGAAGGGQVGVRVANACDAGGSPGLKSVQVNSCAFAFTVAPNPAGDQVTIDATDKSSQASASSAQHKIYKIEIIDQIGNKRREFEFKQGITISTLDISGLPTGLYTIRAYNGTVWSGIQLLKN